MVYRVAAGRGAEVVAVARMTRVTIPRGEVVLDGATVNVAPFLIDRNLVRRSDYRAYARATGARLPPSDAGDDDLPVVGITYEDAAAYATSCEGRIPTEAEWQLSAAGFGDRAYPSGTGQLFREDRGPQQWRDALPARRPRAVGAGAPLNDGVFGLSDLGEVWELTSTRAPLGMIVRGGAWRDRRLPPRLDNRSSESEPAHDVGFRCAYPMSATYRPKSGGGIPGRRAPACKAWRAELLATDDGRRAYMEQELARLGRPYVVEAMPLRIRSVREFEALVEWTPEDIREMKRAEELALADMRTSHARRYRIGDDRYYDVYVEGDLLCVTHSRETGGVDGPSQVVVYGETSTRLALGVFAALDYDASEFMRHVVEQFEGNHDCPT